jgi:hypothetical protein
LVKAEEKEDESWRRMKQITDEFRTRQGIFVDSIIEENTKKKRIVAEITNMVQDLARRRPAANNL